MGKWPPAPAVCVEFGAGVLTHPAIRTAAAMIAAIAPVDDKLLIGVIPAIVYMAASYPLA
ncbi:MAG: hypothetical protein WCB79_05740 [Halobacteriota archaeon]